MVSVAPLWRKQGHTLADNFAMDHMILIVAHHVSLANAHPFVIFSSCTTSIFCVCPQRHPIYGELVRDFGYKRVYAIEVDALVDVSKFPGKPSRMV